MANKVIDMRDYFEYMQMGNRIRQEESEKVKEALFIDQHSDDDSFTNENEFEFRQSDD